MSKTKDDAVTVVETKTCIDCGKSFTISESERSWYKEMGFEEPKRCKDCRKKRKGDRGGKKN